jgi:poly(3-hydroxyalkanoate) synthetase
MATGLDLDVGHDLREQNETVVTITLTKRKLKETKQERWGQDKQNIPNACWSNIV